MRVGFLPDHQWFSIPSDGAVGSSRPVAGLDDRLVPTGAGRQSFHAKSGPGGGLGRSFSAHWRRSPVVSCEVGSRWRAWTIVANGTKARCDGRRVAGRRRPYTSGTSPTEPKPVATAGGSQAGEDHTPVARRQRNQSPLRSNPGRKPVPVDRQRPRCTWWPGRWGRTQAANRFRLIVSGPGAPGGLDGGVEPRPQTGCRRIRRGPPRRQLAAWAGAPASGIQVDGSDGGRHDGSSPRGPGHRHPVSRSTDQTGAALAPPRPVLRAALSPGAGFAIATGLMVATRCTRLWGDCLAPPRPVLRAALSPGAGFAIAVRRATVAVHRG